MPTNTSQRQIIPTNTRSINNRLFQLTQGLSTADYSNSHKICQRQIIPTNTSQRQIMPTNTSQRQIIATNTRSINDRLFQLTQDLSTTDYSN